MLGSHPLTLSLSLTHHLTLSTLTSCISAHTRGFRQRHWRLDRFAARATAVAAASRARVQRSRAAAVCARTAAARRSAPPRPVGQLSPGACGVGCDWLWLAVVGCDCGISTTKLVLSLALACFLTSIHHRVTRVCSHLSCTLLSLFGILVLLSLPITSLSLSLLIPLSFSDYRTPSLPHPHHPQPRRSTSTLFSTAVRRWRTRPPIVRVRRAHCASLRRTLRQCRRPRRRWRR